MIIGQTAVRESLCRRILDLPDEEIGLIERYVSDLEGHEPNEETIAAMREADELARMYSVYLGLGQKNDSSARH